MIMYALCQVERWHSIGNWDSPRLCLSWDCRCGAAGAIERAACTPLFYWKAEAVTCMSHSFIFLILVDCESLFIVDRTRRIVFHMK